MTEDSERFVGANTPLGRAATAMLLASLVVALGCSEDVGDSTFDSGLDGSATAGSLSSDEFETLCTGVRDYLQASHAVRDYYCQASGYVAARVVSGLPLQDDEDVRDACQSAYDQCYEIDPTASTCTDPAEVCSAEVSEIEECVSAIPQSYARALDDAPACSELTVSSFNEPLEYPLTSPESCQRVSNECPLLFSVYIRPEP
ncbi:MAG: hypothetical protein HRU17_21750 [Polyangiaceae bacterium]|nr:hypothetical protein [Polyangiaceae bacterium]